MWLNKFIRLSIIVLFLILYELFLNNAESLDLNLQQNEYKFTFERMEAVRFNKVYVKTLKINTFKYNRTCPFINMSVEYNIDLNYELELISQAYTFLSNEYRDFPMRFEINYCDAMSKNFAGFATAFQCGNFTGCPLKKGMLYHACNWSPDASKFPPRIPNGKYMFEEQALYDDAELFVLRLYGTVDRPILVPPVKKIK